jgi:hypothetical protein
VITLLATVTLSATLALRSAPADAGADVGPSFSWVIRGERVVVEVSGLGDDLLSHIRGGGQARDVWTDILPVRVARPPGDPEPLPIVGDYSLEGNTVRFTPRYPFLAGRTYSARLRWPIDRRPVESRHTLPAEAAGPPSRVVAVYPTTDLVPENLLKVYLEFSSPPGRGEAYKHVRILDASGRPIERPFLEIGEELWDPDGKRLTLLFDPGRIKRGLVPRLEEGPILEQGKTYTLVVDRRWPDAEGRPLAADYRKSFRAGPPDETQPDPKRWTIEAPSPGSRDPLIVRFPEPLDHAMLRRAMAVEAAGATIRGAIEVGEGERSWRFVPELPWPASGLTLMVDTELEDLAGNSIARPFEVDVVRDGPAGPSRRRVGVPVPGRSQGPRR